MKMDIDRHGPRLMPNNCKNLNRPYFSLPSTFNVIKILNFFQVGSDSGKNSFGYTTLLIKNNLLIQLPVSNFLLQLVPLCESNRAEMRGAVLKHLKTFNI
jgi:hypothetical protein